MEQKTIRILMTDSKSLKRLWRGIRRNRTAIGLMALALGLVELQVKFLENNLYHHIQEYNAMYEKENGRGLMIFYGRFSDYFDS